MISPRTYAVVALVGLLLTAYIARKILNRRLRAEYALLWGGLTAIILVMSLWRGSLGSLSSLLGIYYGPAVLILVGGAFGTVYLVHLSERVSLLMERTKRLTQELAMVRLELERSRSCVEMEQGDPRSSLNDEA